MSGAVWERIEESRARHNVLEHPFYVRWSAGELGREELARYAGQYRHATEALARLCRQTAETAPEEHREEIEATRPRRRPTSASGTTSSRPPAGRSAPSPPRRPPSA